MKISQREGVLLLITAAVGLFGASALLARPKLDEWKELRQEQARVRSLIAADRQTLGEQDRWRQEFAKLSEMIKQFTPEEKMDVHWLSLMDDTARRYGVSIRKRQVGEEKKAGEVYEMPIECQEWEGRPEDVWRFLFELQSQGAMLDIRQLLVKPKEQRTDDSVKGRFTLYCAYGRSGATPRK